MKTSLHISKKLIVFVSLLIFISGSLIGQIPEGGTSLIRDYYNNYSVNGSNTVTKVAIEGQSFTNALNCRIGPNVANSWNAQLLFSPETGIETGDVILVTFWARTTESLDETGSGLLTICIEHRTTYDKVIYQTQHIGADWQQYFIPLTSNATLTTNLMALGFHLGYPSQTIQVAEVKFINYKNEYTIDQLPVTIPSYIGREDAEWRAGAEERINQYRKGQMQIRVVDNEGNPVVNAQVNISMQRHKFAFGSAIDAETYLNNASYRGKVKELFNEIVFENDLKMNRFSTRNTSQRNRILQVIDDLDAANITARGHTSVWPSFQYNPSYLQNYRTDPVTLRFEIDKHIEEITNFFQGRLVDWDVMNEPFTETEWMNILGKDVMVSWYNQVRNYDPSVKLYINEFGILSGMGLNSVKQNAYIETIKYIEENGGRIDGIGMQGHFAEGLTAMDRLKFVLDKYAELDKEIKITEFDIDSDRRELQADYLRDFMTMMFSHPSVAGVLMWGFWENRHWRPRAAIYDSDWTIREHGQMYRDMVFNRWWTPDTILKTDDQGYVNLEGFLGTYSVTIDNDGLTRETTIELIHSNSSEQENNYFISLNPEIPVSLTLKKEGKTIFCEGGQLKLSVEVPQNFTLKWYNGDEQLSETSNTLIVTEAGNYHVIAETTGITITSDVVPVQVWDYPESEITVTGNVNFVDGQNVVLNAPEHPEYTYKWFKDGQYFRGSSKSIQLNQQGIYTLETNHMGCRKISDPVILTNVTGDMIIPGNSDRLLSYPNPFNQTLVVELPSACNNGCLFRIVDMMGKEKFSRQMATNTAFSITPDLSSGMYMIEVIAGNEVERVKVIKQ